MPGLRCNVGVDISDLFGGTVLHTGEDNLLPSRIHLDEIVVLRARYPQRDPAGPI